MNVSNYLSNPQTCQCKEPKFGYDHEPHGHVITGDLKIIENAKLRELVAKGPKHRESNRVNWKATETMFLESIDVYGKNWSKREQVELKYFPEWQDQLRKLVADHISNFKGILNQLNAKPSTNLMSKKHSIHVNYMQVMLWSLQIELPIINVIVLWKMIMI